LEEVKVFEAQLKSRDVSIDAAATEKKATFDTAKILHNDHLCKGLHLMEP